MSCCPMRMCAGKCGLAESYHVAFVRFPLDAIVGSVGRYQDFTRTFLPKHDSDQDRWAGGKGRRCRNGRAAAGGALSDRRCLFRI